MDPESLGHSVQLGTTMTRAWTPDDESSIERLARLYPNSLGPIWPPGVPCQGVWGGGSPPLYGPYWAFKWALLPYCPLATGPDGDQGGACDTFTCGATGTEKCPPCAPPTDPSTP